MNESSAPVLPLPALVVASVFLLLLFARTVAKEPTSSGRFLLTVVWLRVMMQAYHQWTFQSYGGFTLNALASLAACGVGAVLFFPQIRKLQLLPFALGMVVIILLSGAVNDQMGATLQTLPKWGLFFFVFLATREVISRQQNLDITRKLLVCFSPVLVFQILSLILGIAKSGESDGSASYIGGFNHEAIFSMLLAAVFLLASIAPRIPLAVRLTLLAYCVFGLFAANYRTTILAILPMALGYIFVVFPSYFSRSSRSIPIVLAMLVGFVALFPFASFVQTRAADLQFLATSSGPLLKSPADFTSAEADVLSGRWFTWNQFYDEYRQSSDVGLLIGNGADSWTDFSPIYAHNTLISYLYEFGVFGVALTLALWTHLLFATRRIPDGTLRRQMALIHVSFIVLNMATMPMWAIEGLIIYGIICGVTMAFPNTRNSHVTSHAALAQPTSTYEAPQHRGAAR